MSTIRIAGVIALAATMACQENPGPDWSGSSSNVSLSRGGDALYVADGDNGMLVRVDLADGTTRQVVVGSDPRRVARVGDRLYVTLGAESAVAVLVEGEDGLTLVATHEVGAEPFGIAAAPDGKALYVALGLEGAVVELEPDGLDELRRFAIPGQPRWVVAHPSGQTLYVASSHGGGVYAVALAEGEVREVALPRMERGVPDARGEAPLVDLVPRVTGDPAVSPDGDVLAVPALYVDNTTPVNGSSDPSDLPDRPVESSDGYASGNIEFGLTRFNPSVVTIPLDAAGDPQDHGAVATLVAGRGSTQELHDHIVGEQFGVQDTDLFQKGDLVRGYLSGLTFDPTGRTVLATIEGARAIAVVPTEPVSPGVPNRFDDEDPFFGNGAFESTVMTLVGTEDGPQGLAFSDDTTAWAFNFLDRSVSRIDYGRAERAIASITEGHSETFTTVASFFAGAEHALPPSLLPPDVVEGRRLFFSAGNSAMAVPGAGVSCATCHFDGRNDGLTWTFDLGVRQTPSLAGKVSQTAPVTWTSDVESVAREAFLTSQGRMGGDGITTAQTLDIAAYIDWSRDVVVPRRADADPAVARGRAVFERPDVACAACHVGERKTDNRAWPMFGLEAVNTPGLVGLKATAPYLHDGSAATLRDLVLGAEAGGMGYTEHLTPGEVDDLVAYLESL